MKKIAGIAIISLFLGLIGPHVIEAKKEIYVLCNPIVSPKVLHRVKVQKKKLKDGIRIVLKTKDEKRVELLKAIVGKCLKDAESMETDADHQYELLYRKGINCTLTDLKGGIQLELVSENPDLVKIVKKVYFPVQRRSSSDLISDIEGGSTGDSDEEIR